jgi:excisionase family DNA binding protein
MRRPQLLDLDTHDFDWVTPRELARYLKIHERTIRRMIEAGSLHAYRAGRNWHIPTHEAQRAFPQTRQRSA